MKKSILILVLLPALTACAEGGSMNEMRSETAQAYGPDASPCEDAASCNALKGGLEETVSPEDGGLPSPGFAASRVPESSPRIEGVYLAQTHVLSPEEHLVKLVGNRPALLKVQLTAADGVLAPSVTATVAVKDVQMLLTLTGPSVLRPAFESHPGRVEHSFEDSYTAVIPAEWVRPGLTLDIRTRDGHVRHRPRVGAPTELRMHMFDVHYFGVGSGDYPEGWDDELASKWPVASVDMQRIRGLKFQELVIPPRSGTGAIRVTSRDAYLQNAGPDFQDDQDVALQWAHALSAAGGNQDTSICYINILGVPADGQAGSFNGVGGISTAVLNHQLGHALSLPHWGDSAVYPYKGDMHGISAPDTYQGTHVGPTWAFDMPSMTFIPPTVQETSGEWVAGTYKASPMQGGGAGDQEPGFHFRHFSDHGVAQMQSYLENKVAVQSEAGWFKWNDAEGEYTTPLDTDGVRYPIETDAEIYSLMAATSLADRDVNLVYPPIGPYTAGLIRRFDVNNEQDRLDAEQVYCPSSGCDFSLRILQGPTETTYMLAASAEEGGDPLAVESLTTVAINLPERDGEIFLVELLLTPDAQREGLPDGPEVLSRWESGEDACPQDADKTLPGQCGCGASELDSDHDGSADCVDGCPVDANKLQPGQCGCGASELDSDHDGSADCQDRCPEDPAKLRAGQCGCGIPDLDPDGDGTANCRDGCPEDAAKTEPGTCGCGMSDGDSDGDGAIDCEDGCPEDPDKLTPGLCGCGLADVDSDADGTEDCRDGCPGDLEKLAPGTCGCGAADTDSDGDGAADCQDGCPDDTVKTEPGPCGCGVLDTDSDGDGSADCQDGCPADGDKLQAGTCGCGVPDADSDGDGAEDCQDGCPADGDKLQAGICGCGVPDADSDGDGTVDCQDGCPDDGHKLEAGVCGCGVADVDSDGDGAADCQDGCPEDNQKLEVGACGCGLTDADADADGTPDCQDACPEDGQKSEAGDCGCGLAEGLCGPVGDIMEAEQADVLSGVEASSSHAGFTGDGFIDFGGRESALQWDALDASCAGDYRLVFRYANGGANPRPTEVFVNEQSAGSVHFAPTGGWESWESDDIKVSLQPGSNGLRLVTTGSAGGPNLDHLQLYAAGNCVDMCPDDADKISPGACGCGIADTDSDGDGSPDCQDGCPDDSHKLQAGTCGCGVAEDDCAVISASGENTAAGEVKENAFDGDVQTKWLTFSDSAWIQYQVTAAPGVVFNSYNLSSANDCPERDPRDWRLLGSVDGGTWVVLDERSGETFSERFQTRSFSFDNTETHGSYRLDILSNLDPETANSTQIAELSLKRL